MNDEKNLKNPNYLQNVFSRSEFTQAKSRHIEKERIQLAEAQRLLSEVEKLTFQYNKADEHIEKIDFYSRLNQFVKQSDEVFDFTYDSRIYDTRREIRQLHLSVNQLEQERLRKRISENQIKSKEQRKLFLSEQSEESVYDSILEGPFTPIMDSTSFSLHTPSNNESSQNHDVSSENTADLLSLDSPLDEKTNAHDIIDRNKTQRYHLNKNDPDLLHRYEVILLIKELQALKIQYVQSEKNKRRSQYLHAIFDFFSDKVYPKNFTRTKETIALRKKLNEMLMDISTINNEEFELTLSDKEQQHIDRLNKEAYTPSLKSASENQNIEIIDDPHFIDEEMQGHFDEDEELEEEYDIFADNQYFHANDDDEENMELDSFQNELPYSEDLLDEDENTFVDSSDEISTYHSLNEIVEDEEEDDEGFELDEAIEILTRSYDSRINTQALQNDEAKDLHILDEENAAQTDIQYEIDKLNENLETHSNEIASQEQESYLSQADDEYLIFNEEDDIIEEIMASNENNEADEELFFDEDFALQNAETVEIENEEDDKALNELDVIAQEKLTELLLEESEDEIDMPSERVFFDETETLGTDTFLNEEYTDPIETDDTQALIHDEESQRDIFLDEEYINPEEYLDPIETNEELDREIDFIDTNQSDDEIAKLEELNFNEDSQFIDWNEEEERDYISPLAESVDINIQSIESIEQAIQDDKHKVDRVIDDSRITKIAGFNREQILTFSEREMIDVFISLSQIFGQYIYEDVPHAKEILEASIDCINIKYSDNISLIPPDILLITEGMSDLIKIHTK